MSITVRSNWAGVAFAASATRSGRGAITSATDVSRKDIAAASSRDGASSMTPFAPTVLTSAAMSAAEWVDSIDCRGVTPNNLRSPVATQVKASMRGRSKVT